MNEPSRISKLAIASLIVSLFFVIPLISGLAAIILGVVALYNVGLYNKQLTGKWFAIIGITLGFFQIIFLVLASLFVNFIILNARFSDFTKANFYFNIGNYTKAIEYYGKALDNSKDNKFDKYNWAINENEFLIYDNMGTAYHATRQVDKALVSYVAALGIARKSEGIAHYGIGTVYSDSKDYENAVKELDMAIEYNPGLVVAYQEKASVLRMMGKPEESLLAAQRVISLFPDFAQSYSTAGLACEKLERYEDAIKYHIEAIHLNPKRFYPRDRLYFCFYRLHNEQKRFELLNKLREVDYNFAQTLERKLQSGEPPEEGSSGEFDNLNKGPREPFR